MKEQVFSAVFTHERVGYADVHYIFPCQSRLGRGPTPLQELTNSGISQENGEELSWEWKALSKSYRWELHGQISQTAVRFRTVAMVLNSPNSKGWTWNYCSTGREPAQAPSWSWQQEGTNSYPWNSFFPASFCHLMLYFYFLILWSITRSHLPHLPASTHLLLHFTKEEKRNLLWTWKNPELGNEKKKGEQELRMYKAVCLIYTTGKLTIMFFLAIKAHFHSENHVCMDFLHSCACGKRSASIWNM